jgi:hypothetical protein
LIMGWLLGHAFFAHCLLIGGEVLATVAVGLGILWEAPEQPKERHLIATRLVIWGIVFETLCSVGLFAFDEAISHVQQEKIIALSPRELDSISRAKIASCSVLPGAPVLVQSLYADSEGYRLASEIMDALHKGGIAVDDGRGRAEIDLTRPQPFGVFVEGPQSEVPFVLCLAKSIRETKELSGTVAKRIPDRYPLSVYVGLKPID